MPGWLPDACSGVITTALLAVAAAASFAFASVVQHGAASNVPMNTGGPLALMSRLLREPRWLIGKAADAVAFALQAVALELLDDHLAHCVREAMTSGGPDADAKVAEASAAIARLVRS